MVRAAEYPQLIERALRDGLGQPELRIISIRAGATAARALAGDEVVPGAVGLDLTVTERAGAPERVLSTVVKAAHTNGEIDAYRQFASRPDTRGVIPAFYGAATGEHGGLLVVERIRDAILLDSADDVAGWHPPMRWRMIEAMAAIHAVGLRRADAASMPPLDADALLARIRAGRASTPRIVTPDVERIASKLATDADNWLRVGAETPRTLVHGAFFVENLCFRADRSPVIFDWSHTAWASPQRDLADLLASTLRPGFEQGSVWEPVERHRLALERASGIALDPDAWRAGFRAELRLGLLMRVAPRWSTPASPYLARLTAVSAELVHRTNER